MLTTFQNSAQVLSIGVFFTLIILGLAGTLPSALYHGLTAQGLSPAAAHKAASLPPVASLFAAFLGYNPIRTLVGPALKALPAHQVSYLTGRSFFPSLIARPFHSGLGEAFTFAVVACLVAAAASWMRGAKFHYGQESGTPVERATEDLSPLGTQPLVEAADGEVVSTPTGAPVGR